MTRPTILMTLIALPLAGCAAGPDYRPKGASELGVPSAYSVEARQEAQADLRQWWTAFDDPLLTRLVEQAATQNLDVAQAVARLRQAREALVQSRASLLPDVSAGAGASRTEGIAGQSGRVASHGSTITNTLDL